MTACREAGLTHFVLVRHANAAPLRSGAAVRKDAPHDWKIAGASITFMAGGAVVYFLLVLLIEVRSRGDVSVTSGLAL